jgi:hypothetical protein
MPVPIDFQILRHIAESASGLRYQDVWFVITRDPRGGPVVTPQFTKPTVEDPDATVIFCAAVDYPPSPTVTLAQIGIDPEVIDLLNVTVPEDPAQMDAGGTFAADAVFWSLSAVEKFLTPYYASVYGDEGGRMVEAVLGVLQPGIDVILDPLADAPPYTLAAPDQAFAIAHLPNSEYVGETMDLAGNLFSLHPGGAVRRIVPRPRGGYGAEGDGQSGSRA